MLRLRNMNAIDGTGIHALEDLASRLRATGRSLVICGLREQPTLAMSKAEVHHRLGEENIVPSLEAAIARAKEILAED